MSCNRVLAHRANVKTENQLVAARHDQPPFVVYPRGAQPC
jgi:hypothetical protein